jgi:microcystin degradation protein MlrC
MQFVICGVAHETNTFSNIPTGLKAFQKAEGSLLIGSEIIQTHKKAKTEIGGFITYCMQEGINIIPTLTASAQPAGKVTTNALEEFLDVTIKRIENEEMVGAVLACLHGAMVSEDQDDAEGYFLKRIREAVDPNVPIVATLDLHSNITKAMIHYADILVGYDTNPHEAVDMFNRGVEAAELAHKMTKKEIYPTIALSKIPFWPPGQMQVTKRPPMKDILDRAFEYEEMEEVLTVTISAGFAWADIEEMGFGAVVTTNNDQALAEKLAKELTNFVWTNRERFYHENVPVDEAVERAIQASEGPIILADVSDNPGGGTPCDGTVLLQHLLDKNAQDVAFALIADPEAVHKAISSGVGTEVTLQIGGKVDDLHGSTLTLTGKVKLISDGEVHWKGPMATGVPLQFGKSVVFQCQGIDLLLTENRIQALDREIFRRNGITPEERKILVLKSLAHFRADFEPIAKEIIEVATPGILSSDLSIFNYKKISRPFWPLDRDKF